MKRTTFVVELDAGGNIVARAGWARGPAEKRAAEVAAMVLALGRGAVTGVLLDAARAHNLEVGDLAARVVALQAAPSGPLVPPRRAFNVRGEEE